MRSMVDNHCMYRIVADYFNIQLITVFPIESEKDVYISTLT